MMRASYLGPGFQADPLVFSDIKISQTAYLP